MNLLPGTSEEALLALINTASPTLPQPLVPGDLYFGKIKTLSGGRVEIPAVTMYDSAYEGYVKFQYKRLNLSQAFGSVRPALRDIGYPSLHQLLPVINKALGINLQPRDVYDTQIAWLGNNENLNIQVTASAESLGYEGSFVVTFTRVRPMLTSVVTQPVLDVQVHPTDPVKALKSLSMHMYSLDFTGNESAFTIYYTGIWWNLGALRTLMTKHGFPNWPQGGRDDCKAYLTKDLPSANPAFTNVVVQKNVTINGYTGDAYFHYNRT